MDFIILGIVGILVMLAIMYIIKTKKSGSKCIGCPDGKKCSCSHCDSK